MAWLPTIGGLAAPAFISIFIDFLKLKVGWGKGYEDRINLILSIGWAAAAAAMEIYPGMSPWVVLIVQTIWGALGAFGFHEAFLRHE